MNNERVWVEDKSWRVLRPDEQHKCTWNRCPAPAVALFYRPIIGRRHRHWGCPDHLYGRRVEGGKVLIGVAPDSPAAERGYVG